MSLKSILLHIARLGFGVVFIWSGVAKLKDPISFADAVRNFEMVNDPVAPAMALLIPWVEIVGAVVVIAGVFWRGGVITLLASLFVFTGALCIAWGRGLDISCGCFGGSGAVNYPLVVGRNIVLIILGFVLLAFVSGQNLFFPKQDNLSSEDS